MNRDILIDDSGDLKCLNGDFVIGNADEQNVKLIIFTSPGDWKESPVTGAGLIRLYNGTLSGFAQRNLKLQLETNGYKVNSITSTENGINVSVDSI